MKLKIVVISLIIILVQGCQFGSSSRLDIAESKLSLTPVTIKRYGKALFELDTNKLQSELKNIQSEFPQFLNGDLDDTSNINRLRAFVSDSQLIHLYHKTIKVYPGLSEFEQSLSRSFGYLSWHFPQFEIPQVYTYISGIQADAPVLAADKSLVIALDCYLGQDEEVYKKMGIPVYKSRRMTPEHIITDVFSAVYAVYFETQHNSNTLLDEMVAAGKRYYFLEAVQPEMEEYVLLGYSKEQFDWIKKHEGAVWSTLVGEQILYKGDQILFRKMFADGPFSQDFSQEAPPRLGEYIGWQIVRGFMEKNEDVSISDLLLITDSQKILAGSNYKPRR